MCKQLRSVEWRVCVVIKYCVFCSVCTLWTHFPADILFVCGFTQAGTFVSLWLSLWSLKKKNHGNQVRWLPYISCCLDILYCPDWFFSPKENSLCSPSPSDLSPSPLPPPPPPPPPLPAKGKPYYRIDPVLSSIVINSHRCHSFKCGEQNIL